ncbi:MAG TPA: NADH-ubiquinone oxidoreductase-F iron-sulfur binding region domain-containing protein [Streptosporangiaceae bacterium]|nr:NADH-ubiquinone oxidoreductase-F iron-sulfur binding region domain-containing protein [Streptosporangiaceae bacterium]
MVAQAVTRIGPARITAGMDRYARLDLAAHEEVFGPAPQLPAITLIEMCEQVDLRGRGGAAFPVARKLRAVHDRANGRRRAAVVVNGTEGEPGSSKDKTLLARSPHLVLDGAALVAKALQATDIVVAVTGNGPQAQSVADAVAADEELSEIVRVVRVPDRFVSGEGGALINAINGQPALPPGTKTLPSDSGVRGRPTLLSNAETFAQIAVLARLGPAGYASAGIESEPGTVLLTVGGSVANATVVETPTGMPLGHILDLCGAEPPRAVLVGGYHGMWISPDVAYDLPVSRGALSAVGGALGAGVVLVLGRKTCPLGEVARVASFMAAQSSGQCGPCRRGLPAVARSLAALAAGSGGPDELEAARRTAAGVRGRGACAHPNGTANFVGSALDVFSDDLAEHMFRGTCGQRTADILPLTRAAGDGRLAVDWTRCEGHGLCARLAPELIKLDADGYPQILDMPVPFWLSRHAAQAVDMCPALALTLTRPAMPRAARPVPARPAPAAITGPADPPPQRRPRQLADRSAADRGEPPTLTGRAVRRADLDKASAWLAEISGNRRAIER